MQFTVDIEGLDELERDWSDAVGALADGVTRGVERGVTEGAAQARASHPYQDRTGALTGSIEGFLERSASRTAGGEAVGVLKAGKRYASFVEGGTAPHTITPKKGGPLTFEVGGEWVSTREVKHPGTREMPFMGPAVLKAERVIEVEAEVAADRAAAIMNR